MGKSVAIVGGGVTGLAASYELQKQGGLEIHLYEVSNRLGGKLRTERTPEGFVVEHGPDCFFARKPGAIELVHELGLEDELIGPQRKSFAMLIDGSLESVAFGLVSLNAVDPTAITDCSFLSEAGKARAIEAHDVPTESGERGDLSIREFFTERYGAEFCALVAEPLLAGTHGGDPAQLSMRALYPTYLGEAPISGAPVVGAPMALPNHLSGATFLSFRRGMQTLVDALAGSLSQTHLHLESSIERLTDLGSDADAVIVAVPADHAAKLLPNIGLEAIPHRSSAIVTLGYRAEQLGFGSEAVALSDTGFLVPPQRPYAPVPSLTGATYSSAKWAGRAPEGSVLIRVFLRESGATTTNDAPGKIDASEIDAAERALRDLLKIEGSPIFAKVDRWTDALPQYNLGHRDRVAQIRQQVPANVVLAGTSLEGVGIPDAIRQGREAARRILSQLSLSHPEPQNDFR